MLSFSLFFFVLVLFFSNFLLDGITQNFFERLLPFVSIFLVIAIMFKFSFKFFKKNKFFGYIIQFIENKIHIKNLKFTVSDDLIFLIPAGIVLNYYLFNLIKKEISIQSFFSELSILFFPIFLIILAINFLKIKTYLKFNLKFNLVIFLILISSIPFLSSIFGWHEKGSLKIICIFLSLLILILFLMIRFQKKLIKIFSLIFIISICFSQIFNNYFFENLGKNNVNLEKKFFNKKIINKPNIYLLTYDSYVNKEVMKNYGIDNSYQEMFLKNEGFTIYPNTYTISTQSIFSMGRMLNLRKHNEHISVAGDNFTCNLLKKNGYKTYGIFRDRYFFNSQNNTDFYDESYPKVESRGILNAILSGEFLWDINKVLDDSKTFIKIKSKYLTSKSNFPVFLYTHTGPYHSPKNGVCNYDKEVNLFKKRVYLTNLEMQKDVMDIKKENPNSIIIINGDHGPFLLNKCGKYSSLDLSSKVDKLFLRDNFGTFLAIYWPDEYQNRFPNTSITILQDVFFEIFEFLFDSKEIYKFKIEPETDQKESGEYIAAGVIIKNNKIIGGKDHGKKLF